MAAICHIRLLKIKNLNFTSGAGDQHASAYQILKRSVKPLQRYRDFCDFQHGGRRHIGSSKNRNFNGWCAERGQYSSPCQISSKLVERLERWLFNVFFQNGGRPPSWICWAPIGATHDNHLVVSIVVPNLLKIDAVVSIIWNLQYFARLAWKRLFTPQKWSFEGISPPKWGAVSTKPPKGTSLHESASFEPSSVKIRQRVWPVGELMKKGINK